MAREELELEQRVKDELMGRLKPAKRGGGGGDGTGTPGSRRRAGSRLSFVGSFVGVPDEIREEEEALERLEELQIVLERWVWPPL